MTATATDPQRAALYRAILDDPEDDAVRLVYADFLDEYGGEDDRLRAEFIRVQVVVARLEMASGHPRTTPLAWSCKCDVCEKAKPLRRRQNWLWSPIPNPPGHPCQWFDVPNWACHCKQRERVLTWAPPDYSEIAADVRRGFVSEVRAPLAALLAHGAAILGAHPVTRMVAADREPDHEEDNRWHWFPGDHDAADVLPIHLFDALTGQVNQYGWATDKAYGSREKALEALHAVTLAFCRGQAEKARKEAEGAAAAAAAAVATEA